jgi:hypothetical protein
MGVAGRADAVRAALRAAGGGRSARRRGLRHLLQRGARAAALLTRILLPQRELQALQQLQSNVFRTKARARPGSGGCRPRRPALTNPRRRSTSARRTPTLRRTLGANGASRSSRPVRALGRGPTPGLRCCGPRRCSQHPPRGLAGSLRVAAADQRGRLLRQDDWPQGAEPARQENSTINARASGPRHRLWAARLMFAHRDVALFLFLAAIIYKKTRPSERNGTMFYASVQSIMQASRYAQLTANMGGE